MKLHYKVSEENYLEMLEMQIRRQDRAPLAVALTLLCTVGQMGLLIFLIFRGYITGMHVYILLALSVLVCVLNILHRRLVRRRARVAIDRYKLQGKLTDAFWKEHYFELDEDSLTIRYGALRSVYGLQEVNGYDELPSAYLIYCRGAVADIVPYAAVGDREQFLDRIRQAQHTNLFDVAGKLRDDVPEEYKYHFHYAYTLESYLAQQREGYRRRYTTKVAFDMHTILRFAISLYALFYIYLNPKPWIIAVCAAAFLLLNLQHIVTFTPLVNLTVKQGLTDVLAHRPDPETDAYITTDSIVIRGSMHALDIPLKDILAARRITDGVALYLPKNGVLTIPCFDPAQKDDFEKFCKFIDYKAN